MAVSRYWVLKKRVKGMPKVDDFMMIKEMFRELEDGEILIEAEYFSVDPFVREVVLPRMPIGGEIPGAQVGKVIESKDPNYEIDDWVLGYFGWRDLVIIDVNNFPTTCMASVRLPDMKDLPESYALGCLGLSGLTAYYGMLDGCKPVGGDVCVVTGAGGCVGSLAAQLARMWGCRVIAFAGSDAKMEWLHELIFPELICYKTCTDVYEKIKEVAPGGVDCFFDTYGGEFAYQIMRHMNKFGRVAQVGCLSKIRVVDDLPAHPRVPLDLVNLRRKQVTITGVGPQLWKGREYDAFEKLRKLVFRNKIKVHETVTEDFKNLPQAFIDMLEGKNLGKQIVKNLVK